MAIYTDALVVQTNNGRQKTDNSSSVILSSNLTIGGAVAASEVIITSSASGNLAIPFGSSTNFYHRLTQNTTCSVLTNPAAGQSGVVVFQQGTGSTYSLNLTSSIFTFESGSIADVSPQTNSLSLLSYYYGAEGHILCNLTKFSDSLTTGLERYYALNGDGIDSAAGQNATNITLAGGGGWVSGILGMQAVNFNNVATNQIRAPALNLIGDMTISLWWKLSVGGGLYCPAVAQMIGAGGPNLNYAILSVGNTLAFYGVSDNSYGGMSAEGINNVWVHVVYTRTSSGVLTVHCNDTMTTPRCNVGSGNPSSTILAPHSVPGQDFLMGHRDDNYSGFGGALCHVGVWSRILTNAEITRLYNGGTGRLPY